MFGFNEIRFFSPIRFQSKMLNFSRHMQNMRGKHHAFRVVTLHFVLRSYFTSYSNFCQNVSEKSILRWNSVVT